MLFTRLNSHQSQNTGNMVEKIQVIIWSAATTRYFWSRILKKANIQVTIFLINSLNSFIWICFYSQFKDAAQDIYFQTQNKTLGVTTEK